MIELVVTICLAGLPSSCMTVRVPVEAPTVEFCIRESPQILAMTAAAHPSWMIKRFWCEIAQPPGKDA